MLKIHDVCHWKYSTVRTRNRNHHGVREKPPCQVQYVRSISTRQTSRTSPLQQVKISDDSPTFSCSLNSFVLHLCCTFRAPESFSISGLKARKRPKETQDPCVARSMLTPNPVFTKEIVARGHPPSLSRRKQTVLAIGPCSFQYCAAPRIWSQLSRCASIVSQKQAPDTPSRQHQPPHDACISHRSVPLLVLDTRLTVIAHQV